ncbi:MAG: hypothetical protein FJX29_09765 [Alphaproteobacteria bacterium]|nr:hypothetical protein [Alphaproteobacteria bacterium]
MQKNSSAIETPAPVPAMAEDGGKPFWASQTIWSALAVIGSSAAGAALAWKSGDMAAFGAALTAMLGGINAVIGRFRALQTIR